MARQEAAMVVSFPQWLRSCTENLYGRHSGYADFILCKSPSLDPSDQVAWNENKNFWVHRTSDIISIFEGDEDIIDPYTNTFIGKGTGLNHVANLLLRQVRV